MASFHSSGAAKGLRHQDALTLPRHGGHCRKDKTMASKEVDLLRDISTFGGQVRSGMLVL